ncbi:MAG TPA: prepilin peptidase [Syntrophales bacterium]|nr:prepilin peptidase [Syntrophales bacterium]HPQ43430.1 prepilin peptidase [Syntrophales bacterium]
MLPNIECLAQIFSAILGAIVGSFLNVCIYRIPSGKSIAFPASHCPTCGHPVKFYDNIPIISYIFLRGKCRNCHERISPIYPAVELLTAVMSFILFRKYGLSFEYLLSFVFTCALIVITFIDLKHQIIPDIITLPGIPLFALAAIFVMDVSIKDSLIGILIGGGSLYLVALIYQLLTKRDGMGGGDIKLLAMLGGFLGWQSLWFIIMASSLIGAVAGISVMIAKGQDSKYAIPFGPFLSIGALAYIFWGNMVMNLVFYR